MILEMKSLYKHMTPLKLISKLLVASVRQKIHFSSWNIQQMHMVTHTSLLV